MLNEVEEKYRGLVSFDERNARLHDGGAALNDLNNDGLDMRRGMAATRIYGLNIKRCGVQGSAKKSREDTSGSFGLLW